VAHKSRLAGLIIDCQGGDVETSARFWSEALGFSLDDPNEGGAGKYAVLGGTPAVWNTCMLFFQAVLLGGYAYALLVSRCPLKRQLIVQLAMLAVAFVSLPIGL
jgi:hypothetical protein